MKVKTLFKSLRLATLLLPLLLTACAASPRHSAGPPTEYQRLLAEAQQLSFTLDFDQLRQAFVTSPEYNPLGGTKLEGISDAYLAVEEKQFETCLGHVDRVLESNYMSLEAHMIGRLCSNRMERLDREDHHGYMVEGLMEAIENSGDGQAMESAFQTISASELWGFVRLKGWQVVDESIIYGADGIYDKVQVRDLVSGSEYPLYFEVGPIIRAMNAAGNENF